MDVSFWTVLRIVSLWYTPETDFYCSEDGTGRQASGKLDLGAAGPMLELPGTIGQGQVFGHDPNGGSDNIAGDD